MVHITQQNFLYMGGGQDKPAWTACPPGVKITRAGGKISRDSLPPGGQANRGWLAPRGASCPGGKINWDTGTIAYKLQNSADEKSVVCFSIKQDQERLSTIYWLHKLHKRPYKARFIANSSSCSTTELSKVLTSCLTAIKKHLIKYFEKVYEWSGKNLFWSIKHSGDILNKLKSRGFHAASLSTYDFSTLYTTLPHNLIKEKVIGLIERTFQREGSLYLACNDRNAFFTSEEHKRHYGLARRCVKPSYFFWTIFILDLALSYTIPIGTPPL